MKPAIVALLGAVAAFGQGTALPLWTWTNLNAGGFTMSPVGYDSCRWVGSPLNAHLCFVNYHTRGVSSEAQDAMMSYRYDENRFSMLWQSGAPHGIHHPEPGHQVGLQSWLRNDNYLFVNTNNSYGNTGETILDTWMFDAPGLTVRPVPLSNSSSNANKLTRVWFANTGGELNLSVYDPTNRKLLFVPDYRNSQAQQVCSVTQGHITNCAATSTHCADGTLSCVPPGLNLASASFNFNNNLIYVAMGLIPQGTGAGNYNSVWTYDAAADQWAKLTTTCSGVDCNGTGPPPRNCAGFAYSTVDNKFVMIGGNNAATSCNASTQMFHDTWEFNPVTNAWSELCNATTNFKLGTSVGCGFSINYGTFEKLSYDEVSNVFLFFNQEAGYTGATPQAFAISTPLNYGRNTAAPPSLATSLNVNTPSGDSQTNAFDPSSTVSGPNFYLFHVEDALDSDHTNCQVPRLYVSSIDATGALTYYPTGTPTSICNVMLAGEPNNLIPQSKSVGAVVGGTLMAAFEKHTWSSALGAGETHTGYLRYNPASQTWSPADWTPQFPGGSLVVGNNTITMSPLPTGLAVGSIVHISGGSGTPENDNILSVSGSNVVIAARGVHSGAWSIAAAGMVPCFSVTGCAGQGVGGTGNRIGTYPLRMLDVQGSAAILQMEEDRSDTNPREHRIFVAKQTNGAWVALGGVPLNINVNTLVTTTSTGTIAYYGDMATDGAGNLMACWTEGLNLSRNTLTQSPQLYCKYWNGSTWLLVAGGSLNHAAANWSYSPAVGFSNGKWFIAWTEQAQIGVPALYVSQWNQGANSVASIGPQPRNRSISTGLAYHPNFASDGSGSLYLAWEEQSAMGQHSLGHVDVWNGTAWSSLGTDIAHDLTNGSISDISIGIVQGTPMVYFAELTYDNLQQVYARMWDGSSWVQSVSGSSPPSILDSSPLPSGTAASAYTYQFSSTGAPSPTFSATGLPGSSTLSSSGLFSWTTPTTGTFTFPVTATNSAGSDGPKSFSVTFAAAPIAPHVQDTTPLPAGTAGTAYSYHFSATGSPVPTWTGSGLPSGSSISSSGLLSWASPTANTYSFTVTATNAGGSDGPKTFGLTINSSGIAPIITSPSSSVCTQNVACTITLTASGTPASTWSLTGSLPAGMALTDATNGIISGTAATAGVSTVTVKAANGISPDATQSLTITVAAADNLGVTIQERLYPLTIGGAYVAGVTRTADPVCFGVPFPDDPANGITSVNTLGMSGTTAAQFRPLAVWPSGRVKWALVCTLADVGAGTTNTAMAITGGTGNFGGATLATDNGATITVATGSAVFTVKKANFNILDVVTVGAKTLVATGTSPGLVLTGPDPTATYPANVTCSTDGANHAGVSSLCNHAYSSVNDASSTVIIEENGPVKTVLKADGDLKDGSGNVYMHFTTRLTFWKNKTTAHVETELRNADLGTSNTFATATKGHRGFDARIALNLSGLMTYSVGNESTTPTTGFLSSVGDGVYLYQGLSTFMAWGGAAPPTDCPSLHDSNGFCALVTPDLGYQIVNTATSTAIRTGTAAQWAKGWADIADSTGAGVEIAHAMMAGYPGKSLEFRGGGTDVRIGMAAAENSQPYYQAWPQYTLYDTWLNFHATAPSDLDAEYRKYNLPLVGRVDRTVYNSAAVFPHTLLDPAEEDAFYTSVGATVVAPLASNKMVVLKDSATQATNSTYGTFAWQYRGWEGGGGGNQMDFSLGKTYNFLTRGYTGGLIDAAQMYRWMGTGGFPQADGFTWRSQPSGSHNSLGQPTLVSANKSLATRNWPATWEHVHVYGITTAYYLSGDEWLREGINGILDQYLQTAGIAPQTERGVGVAFENITSMAKDFRDVTPPPGNVHLTADTTTYNALVTQAENMYASLVEPDLCVAGWPSGCTTSTNPKGVSRVRGIFYAGSGGISAGPGSSEPYCATTAQGLRATAAFQNSEFLEGMKEFREFVGTSWAKYQESFDLAYGVSQWILSELYYDDGSGAWAPNTSNLCVIPPAPPIPLTTVFAGVGAVGTGGACGNGYRHYVPFDVAASCSEFYYPIRAEQTVWFPFVTQHAYTGTTSWLNKFKMALARTAFAGATDEFGHYTIAEVIDSVLRPGTLALNPINITAFTDLGAGTYTIGWIAPTNAQSYMVKWGTKRIVDWIGFDPYNNVFTGDPTTTMAWFSATTPSNIPSPGAAGAGQSMTIATGTTGLTASNFAVKAYVGSSSAQGSSSSTVFTGPASVVIR